MGTSDGIVRAFMNGGNDRTGQRITIVFMRSKDVSKFIAVWSEEAKSESCSRAVCTLLSLHALSDIIKTSSRGTDKYVRLFLGSLLNLPNG